MTTALLVCVLTGPGASAQRTPATGCQADLASKGSWLTGKNARSLVHIDDLRVRCAAVESASCVSYVAGVWDALESEAETGSDCVCPPPDMTSEAMGRLVAEWLQKHPTVTTGSAAWAVKQALYERYPCALPRQLEADQ